jgi:homocysteine S-methyltransferase
MPQPGGESLTGLLERRKVVILDGGLATELERRGMDLEDDLWSARILVEVPNAIRRLHLDYLRAGADCVVTSSYQATFEALEKRGLSDEAAAGILRLSVELALEAREEFWADSAHRPGRVRPLVAASIGPYGAFLADGSEYTGDYGLSADGLADFHRRRLELLASSAADLLACETIPSQIEARALVRLIEGLPDSRAWMSFSCRDAVHLSDGSELAVIAAEVAASPQILAVGINCTAPRYVSGLIGKIRDATDKPIVVYPNSGEGYDAGAKRWLQAVDGPLDLAAEGPRWYRQGARIIGGCCRTGPEDIRRLRAALSPPPASLS